MHQHLFSKSKFPDHFAFALGRYLFLLFWFILLNVDVNYSCSLKCIDKNIVNYSYLVVVNYLLQDFRVLNE